MLGGLQGTEALVVRMFHLEGKSYQEISTLVGMPENSIGPILSRARDKLRRAGSEFDGELIRCCKEFAMSTVLPDVPPTVWTIADVQARLPAFPADRIRVYPTPGTATEQDLLEAESRSNRICELIDGTLVEKAMASRESMLAAELIYFIRRYLDSRKLGAVLAPDGLLKILPEQVRAPDVSFIRWERFPGGQLPKRPSSP